MTIELLLASPDRDYVERFMRYMRSVVHEYDWKVKSFTDLHLLSEWVASGKQYDLCAIDAAWLDDSFALERSSIYLPERFIWLGQKSKGEILWNGTPMPVIDKYQSIPNLLSMFINSGLLELGSGKSVHEVGKSRVISIYSTNGGAGKTTLCFHMIKLLRQRNKRTLYVNLELIHAGEEMWESLSDDRFGQLLYYVKTDSDNMSDKLEQAIQHDALLNCDIIPPIKHYNNRIDMSFDDVVRLVTMLRQLQAYDFILLDLGSSLHDSIQGAIHTSDYFYWLVSNETSCLQKSRTIASILNRDEQYNLLSLKQKGAWIFHRSTGKLSGQLTIDNDPLGLPIAGALPMIPEWSSIQSKEEMLQSEYYLQSLSTFFPPSSIMKGGSDRGDFHSGSIKNDGSTLLTTRRSG